MFHYLLSSLFIRTLDSLTLWIGGVCGLEEDLVEAGADNRLPDAVTTLESLRQRLLCSIYHNLLCMIFVINHLLFAYISHTFFKSVDFQPCWTNTGARRPYESTCLPMTPL